MGDNTQNQGQNDMQHQPQGGERQNQGQQNQQGGQGGQAGQGQGDMQQQPQGGERQNQGQQNQQGGQGGQADQGQAGQGGGMGERIDTDGDGRTRDPNDTSPTDQGGQA